MDELRVTVVPKAVEIDATTRALAQHDYSIDIAVQKRLSSDQSEMDGLMGLVEEIADFFRQRRLTQYPAAIWIKTANVPIYAPDHLDQLRQFCPRTGVAPGQAPLRGRGIRPRRQG